MPSIDISTRGDAELDQWIANHERQPGGTALPLYCQLLEERTRRAQGRQLLKFEISLEHLKQTAVRQVCTTYGDLASASGVAWARAYRQMNGPRGHLAQLLDLCHARGLPLLTAICVNRKGVGNGELEEGALTGFVTGARRLGLFVGDEHEFHARCRDECWKWGRAQAEAMPA